MHVRFLWLECNAKIVRLCEVVTEIVDFTSETVVRSSWLQKRYLTTLILEELEVEMPHLAKLQLVTLVEILEGIFHSKR
jgi:hypothetical protein